MAARDTSAARITDAARRAYRRSLAATDDQGAALDAAGELVRRLAGQRTGFWDQETLTWTFDPLPTAKPDARRLRKAVALGRRLGRRLGRQHADDRAATRGMGDLGATLRGRYWEDVALNLASTVDVPDDAAPAFVETFVDAATRRVEQLLSPRLSDARRAAIVGRTLEPLRKAFRAAAARERRANAELTKAVIASSAPRAVARYDADRLDRLDRAWDDSLNEYRGAMVALRLAIEEARQL